MKPVSSSHDLPAECMSGLTSVEQLTGTSLLSVSLTALLSFPPLSVGTVCLGAVLIELEPLLFSSSSSHSRNSWVCSPRVLEVHPGSWKSLKVCIQVSQASVNQDYLSFSQL